MDMAAAGTDTHLHSYLLSQMYGLYFLIVSIIFLSRSEYYKNMIAKTKEVGLPMVMHSLLFLFFGLFVVLIHNYWAYEPRVVITVVSWFFLIRSILWLTFPNHMLKLLKKMWAGTGHHVVLSLLMFFGMYMMTRGFYLFMVAADKKPMFLFS